MAADALVGQETCKDLISINFLHQSISTINHAVISPTSRLGELVYTPSRKKQTAIFVCVHPSSSSSFSEIQLMN